MNAMLIRLFEHLPSMHILKWLNDKTAFGIWKPRQIRFERS